MNDASPDDTEKGGPQAAETWVEQTSAFDRVMSVALSVSDPKTAKSIANEAYVAETTARNHLERLVELRVLTSATANGTTTYSPNSGYLRFRKLSELVEQYDKDEIVKRLADLKADIEVWEDEYGVDDPDELRVKAAADGVSAEETRELLQIASEWESREHEKFMMRDAIERYDRLRESSREQLHS
ncbi:DUF7342 family protein [Halorussus ruber]|uniref:DUF7342 family protein n=1 Tax=Halorussus ruber TaxID=1126238 RepID=UPI001092BF39|nr:ArsR family transcriptional regulator [Halorussus ruber]